MEKCTLKIEVENTITNERDELVSMQITPETYRAIRKLIAERMLQAIAKEEAPTGGSASFVAGTGNILQPPAGAAGIGLRKVAKINPKPKKHKTSK